MQDFQAFYDPRPGFPATEEVPPQNTAPPFSWPDPHGASWPFQPVQCFGVKPGPVPDFALKFFLLKLSLLELFLLELFLLKLFLSSFLLFSRVLSHSLRSVSYV
ncbi:hypothetical protein [Eisenbergiella sp.]